MENSKILTIRKINLLIIFTSILIALALCLSNYTNLDVAIQNHLFNFENKTWLIDRDEPVKKFFFYKLPKITLGVVIVFCLFATIFGFKKKSQFFYENRHQFFLVFLGLSLIPLIAGNIKKFTNVYCPARLEIYGGDRPYVKIFDHYDEGFYQEKRAKCFPAGHAVTGFALFILFFALKKKSHRFLGVFSAIIFGWILGFYQMAKGAHFFGDTLVSMLVCFLIAALLSRIYESRLVKT
jgi:membrane-associated PAP2 superfamily phosphatase